MTEPLRRSPVSIPKLQPELVADTKADSALPTSTVVVNHHDKFWFLAERSYKSTGRAVHHLIRQIKRAATNIADDRPIELIVGVAIGAFVLGAGLRIWRDGHE